jgi:hypothetical protein
MALGGAYFEMVMRQMESSRQEAGEVLR